MKYFFLIINLTFFQLVVKSQTKAIITASVITTNDYIVNICEPINGYYNIENIVTKKNDNMPLSKTNKHIKKEIFIERSSVISVIFLNAQRTEFINRCELLLMPGDSINIEFNLQIDGPQWAKYTGSNAEGHKLFNKINYVPIEKFTGIFNALNQFTKDKNEKFYFENIENVLSSYSNQFDSLLKRNLITKSYKYFMDLNFKILLFEEAGSKLLRYSNGSSSIPFETRKNIIEKFFEMTPATNIEINSLYLSTLYMNFYYDYLACKSFKIPFIDNVIEKNKNIFINEKNIIVNKFLIPTAYIKNRQIQEDLWALNLLTIYSVYRGELSEPSIEQFLDIFPNSKWEKYLRPQLAKFSKVEKVEYKLQNEIKFINTIKDIVSLGNLIKSLPPKKAIFIDIWATWCAPCIRAFAYNQQLDSFLIAMNIEKLYISIDNKKNLENWKKSTNKYSLGGYHYLANEYLINDIKKISGTEKEYGMRIPRYMIVDNSGKIINTDANSPSDFENLKLQLGGINLNNN